jgi:polysaccharide export outer membrane protein
MVAVCIVLPIAVVAQSGETPQKVEVLSSSHALRISSGDLLDIGVFDTPELSGKLRVSEVGEVVVPVAGSVRVSGMTSEEAAVAIEEKFRSTDVLKYPHVSVFIEEYATQGVTVAGDVKNPGIYPLLGSHGLLDLISGAGGVTPTAGKAVTITHKSDPTHPEVVQLDSKPGSIAQSIDIRPGDTINISRAGVVYVLGDVGKPGGFLIENNDRLTVLQAMALAQGTNRTAALDRAKIIRKHNESRDEIKVPLKQIMAGKSYDLRLNDGDILFVPTSAGKVFLGEVGSSVPTVAGAVIYKGW